MEYPTTKVTNIASIKSKIYRAQMALSQAKLLMDSPVIKNDLIAEVLRTINHAQIALWKHYNQQALAPKLCSECRKTLKLLE